MLKNFIPKKIRIIFRKVRDWFRFHLISDEKYLKYQYKKRMGKTLDLEHPTTLNEKIQWIKLYEKDPIRTLCSDKYKVREYIKEKIGEEFLIPLVFHTKDTEDIKPENLPDYPFIIKTNHDSSGGIIVWDKSKMDWEEIRVKLSDLLSKNYYHHGKEWQYKDIEPMIIVEKLLLDKNGKIPNDVKFYCFNGEPKYLFIVKDRHEPETKIINLMDLKWELQNFRKNKSSTTLIYPEPPAALDKMIHIAKILSKDFSFLRVDLYEFNDKIYFGEMTFTPENGFDTRIFEKWDLKFGQMLDLPIETN